MAEMRNLFLFVLVWLLITPAVSWAWSGEVVGITDGDTITVLNSKTLKDVKIRLYGIDTPERDQAFSKRARQFTSKTVYGKIVEVKVMATDRYGRTVAMIFADKTLLNEELVKAGLAWVYWQYCHHPICETWKGLQIVARMDKRGLWAEPDPIPPWEFRRKRKRRGKLNSTSAGIVVRVGPEGSLARTALWQLSAPKSPTLPSLNEGYFATVPRQASWNVVIPLAPFSRSCG